MLSNAHIVGHSSASSSSLLTSSSASSSAPIEASLIARILFTLSLIILLCSTMASCLPIKEDNIWLKRVQDEDIIHVDDPAETASEETLKLDDRVVSVRLAKHVASITRYRISPKKSSRPSSMTSPRKEVNLMIIPLSSIIVFIVLLAISVSRWCVEDVRYTDDETVHRRFHGVMMTPLQRPRQQRMSNDYVEAVRTSLSSRATLERHCSNADGKRTSSPIVNRRLLTRTGAETSARSGRRHTPSRAARTRMHTADGRRRDRMSTTSIPLAELLSTTMAPLIMHGRRGVLLSADDNRLNALRTDDGDDVVERYQKTGGHVFVHPVAPPPAAGLPTSAHAHRRNSSSPASSASLNGSTAATASSWCSDLNPLDGPEKCQSNSDSLAIIDVSTPDLVLSSSPQLARGSDRRSGSIKHHASARRSRFQKECRLRQQLIHANSSTAASKLAQDGLNINMRLFQFSLGDTRSSTMTMTTPCYNSSDSVFIRSASVDNDETCYSESGVT